MYNIVKNNLAWADKEPIMPKGVTLSNLGSGGEWAEHFPAYKWITADVRFSTVCPLPSPLASVPTNVSNLYGLRQGRS